MGVTLRLLRRADRPGLRAMLIACGAFTEEEVRVAEEVLDEAEAGAGEDPYHVIVAETDGRPRGYVCLAHVSLTRGTWHLYWICVDPAAQGSGVGQALQAAAEALAAAQGGERLVLETSGRPDYARARRFYERAGYRAVGRIADFYRPGDDCVTYCKPLAAAGSAAMAIAPSAGRGRGCFAERGFARGEVIEEAPVVVVPTGQLEHLDRTILENYYFQWGEDGAVALGRLSLCNHDYAPNAGFERRVASGTVRLVALRDIAAGEEVTINYNGDPADQSPLGAHYGIGPPR